MDIEDLRKLWLANKVHITNHAKIRMKERMVSFCEVEQVVSTGEVIEKYMNGGYESEWLIAGRSNNGKMLHIVVAKAKERYLFVTVYEPDISLWSDDFRRRKRYEI